MGSMTIFEEHQLAGGAIAGDPHAAAALWEAHRRWVAAILLAHKPRNAELDDLLQDVAMTLVKHIHTLSDATAVKPWLRTIAINTARSAGRRKKVQDAALPVMAASAQRSASLAEADDSHRAGETGKLALQVAQTLPPEYREPLLLRAVRGMSYRHIADVLNLPITTIETRISRARRMLRDELERLEGPAESTRTHSPRADEGRRGEVDHS